MTVFSLQPLSLSSYYATVALLFAVDAATVRLPIHPELLRDPDPFGPAFAKVPIEEGNPVRHGHTLTDAPDEIVFLEATVEKGRRKGIEPAFSRSLGRPVEAQMVTVATALLLAEGDLPQEHLHGISLLPDDVQLRLAGIGLDRLKPFPILHIRMDIGVVEETADLTPFFPQDPKGIDGAWGATDMQ
jgi:hypothetical protein